MAAWAGFFGAIPFGLGLWFPFALACGYARGASLQELLVVPFCVLPLAPFLLVSLRMDRREWPRILAAVVPGLLVGAATVLLFWLAGLVILPAGFFGLVLGLASIGPRWRRGDAAGLALALLGLAPAALYIMYRAVDRRGGTWPSETELALVVALAGLAVLTTFRDWRAERFRPAVRKVGNPWTEI